MRTMRTMRTTRAIALLVGMALILLPACSAPSLPTITDPSIGSPPVHLVIDSKATNDWETKADFPTFVVALDPHTGHTIWRYQLPESASTQILRNSLLQPQVAGDLAIVAFSYVAPKAVYQRGTILALDLTSGQLRWRHDTGWRATGEPVITGSMIYVSAFIHGGPEAGVVEALDRRSGKLLWRRPFLGPTPGTPVVVGDRVFLFVAADSRYSWQLLALNASDGSIVWDHKDDSPLFYRTNISLLPPGYVPDIGLSPREALNVPAPLVGNQLVYVPSKYFKLLALAASDGKLVWEHATAGPDYALVLSQRSDMLCLIPAGGSSIEALDAKTGQTRWQRRTNTTLSLPAAQGDAFYFSETGPIPPFGSPANHIPGDVFALASNDGHDLWRSHGTTPLSAPNSSGPPWVAHGLVGQVLIALDATPWPTLVVFRADNGELVWQHKIQGPSTAWVYVEGGQVYFITPPTMSGSSHTVAAYALSTGAQLWTYETGHL